MILKTTVEVDNLVSELSNIFDYDFDGTSYFEIPKLSIPEYYNIGLIVGSSGSGKTQILKHYFNYNYDDIKWSKNKAIVSYFETIEDAMNKCFSVGLSSIPTLCKPYHVLSNGEQYRAYIARTIDNFAIYDEFTSVINRSVAISLSVGIAKYIRTHNLTNIVFASCHTDIIDWLMPDWVYSCDNKKGYLVANDKQLSRVGAIIID